MMSFSPSCIFDLKIWGFQWLALISSLEKVDSSRGDSSQDMEGWFIQGWLISRCGGFGEGFQKTQSRKPSARGTLTDGIFQKSLYNFRNRKGKYTSTLNKRKSNFRQFLWNFHPTPSHNGRFVVEKFIDGFRDRFFPLGWGERGIGGSLKVGLKGWPISSSLSSILSSSSSMSSYHHHHWVRLKVSLEGWPAWVGSAISGDIVCWHSWMVLEYSE